MSNDIKENLLSVDQWLRVLFIAIFAFVCWVLIFVVGVLVVAQALISLFTGKDNLNLRLLGGALSEYVKQILMYMTYNSDVRPFPFAPFPDLSESQSPASDEYEGEYEEVRDSEVEDSDPADEVKPTNKTSAATRATSNQSTEPVKSKAVDIDADFDFPSDEPEPNDSPDIEPAPVATAEVDKEDDEDDVFADISFTHHGDEHDDDDVLPDLILDDENENDDDNKK